MQIWLSGVGLRVTIFAPVKVIAPSEKYLKISLKNVRLLFIILLFFTTKITKHTKEYYKKLRDFCVLRSRFFFYHFLSKTLIFFLAGSSTITLSFEFPHSQIFQITRSQISFGNALISKFLFRVGLDIVISKMRNGNFAGYFRY